MIAGLMRRPVSTSQVADPTQLPEATSPGQTRSGGSTYGRSLAANQTYVDPVSGVTVLKVTSGSVPISSQSPGISHGYATSGPRVSQPWVDPGDGHTKYTLCLDFISYMVDIDYNDFQAENFRDAGDAAGPGDAGMAFSLHPSTPRRSYYIDSGFIRAFDTETMQVVTPTGFPANIGGSLNWLQTQLNDTWLACMSGTSYKGYKPSTGTTVTMSTARSGLTHDELHIDLKNPYVYMSVDDDASANAPWNLEADTFDTSPDSQTSNGPMSDDHCAPGWGYVCGTAHFAANGGGCYVYRADTDVASQIINGSTGYHDAASDFYTNANWCRDLPAGASVPADLWHLTNKENQDDSDAKVRQYAMALVKNDGSSVRIVGHHDSSGSSYDRFAKCMLSPDGKLVVFTSDMNGSGRWDVFVAKMPVT